LLFPGNPPPPNKIVIVLELELGPRFRQRNRTHAPLGDQARNHPIFSKTTSDLSPKSVPKIVIVLELELGPRFRQRNRTHAPLGGPSPKPPHFLGPHLTCPLKPSCPLNPSLAASQPSSRNTGGDASATFRSASASRTSPSPRYHGRLACVPDSHAGSADPHRHFLLCL